MDFLVRKHEFFLKKAHTPARIGEIREAIRQSLIRDEKGNEEIEPVAF